MRLVSRRDFLRQVTRRAVVLERVERYYGGNPAYSLPTRDSRFWYFPGGLEANTAMCRAVLDAFDPWDKCWCWRPGRHWGFPPGEHLGDEMRAFLRVRTRVRDARIPGMFPGAVLADRGEQDLLVALMVLACYTSWNPTHDVHVVPDHCQQIALVCHHDEVHVECPNAETVSRYVARMGAAGFELPTKARGAAPRPEWMR